MNQLAQAIVLVGFASILGIGFWAAAGFLLMSINAAAGGYGVIAALGFGWLLVVAAYRAIPKG